MTINEFCKMYHVSHQAVYSAIRRHEKDPKEHISKNSNGVKLLDDYAVEFLKPKYVPADKYNAVCEGNDKLRVQNISLVSDNEDLQKRIITLESQIQKEKAATESFRADSSKYFQLSLEKDKRISELEKRISDITALHYLTKRTAAFQIWNVRFHHLRSFAIVRNRQYRSLSRDVRNRRKHLLRQRATRVFSVLERGSMQRVERGECNNIAR